MKRREFIAGLGGAVMWQPAGARAQQSDRARRIGALLGWSQDNPILRSYFAAFAQELARLGWSDGGNVRIDSRWTFSVGERAQVFAKELVALNPDVIFAVTTPATGALQRETRAIPIIFAVVSDPIGAGFAASLARPGGNITGFINVEAAMGGKWLALLRDVAPHIKRAAIMFNPDTAPGNGSYFLDSFETSAAAMSIEPVAMRVRSDAEIERAIASLGRDGGGLVVMSDSFMGDHHLTVISSAARNRVPAVMGVANPGANEGELISYGPSLTDLFQRAAGYVDCILRGAKPADLPIQLPVKYDLAVNLKTAKALGLIIPETLLATADEVIQ
jgi:putative ABC transport system substrate-binding protein